MIHFFGNETTTVFAVHTSNSELAKQTQNELSTETISKLNWLFGNATKIEESVLADFFVGPRAAMVTPWSTNAVEITQNMGIEGITRIEEFEKVAADFVAFDPMLSQKYTELHQDIFTIKIQPEAILEIEDIAVYNQQEGLSLSTDEVEYLENLSKKLNRKLTDSEVFGFSQVNSEHCRHKIFNGKFVIDGVEKPYSLFKLIKKTAAENPNDIVSAYKDNVAFIKGPTVEQFAPNTADKPDFYTKKQFDSVISLKAETHNFPTTVEPFNGAATGSGGEIRDRLAGGQGSLPLAGTAVYMTAYSRLEENRNWENGMSKRKWLYQTPMDILIKASNGASDFGNKFGQPLITGSILTFEHDEDNRKLGYDKVIMQAGGIGYGKASQAQKQTPKTGDKIVILGGENYRIGMGGAAVSLEETGGLIDLDKLPVGDPTLSAKEIIGNESQERMGLVIGQKDIDTLQRIADRERSPMYQVGEVTGNHRFTFESKTTGEKPMDFALEDLFGSSPKVVMNDKNVVRKYTDLEYTTENIPTYLEQVLQLEAVACKDWLTNKVDRCVGGKVAKQQCVGPLQLPLNNVGVMALDYNGKQGIATSIGHAPISALIDPKAGSRNAIGEALTNIVFAPLKDNLQSVSLSANWMWACKNEGEDARLYEAVQACSDFAIELGINIPTGKDSLSMKQKYPNDEVIAPGTVIISAVGNCSDITKVVEPVLQRNGGSIYYINLSQDEFKLGGSSFAQTLNKIGTETPTIKDSNYFKNAFNTIQNLIKDRQILAGHDIGSGGLITTLLEMCFSPLTPEGGTTAVIEAGMKLNFDCFEEKDLVKILFSENIGVVLQAKDDTTFETAFQGLEIFKIGKVEESNLLEVGSWKLEVSKHRDIWFKTSYLLDQKQTKNNKAKERFDNYKNQALQYTFPKHFTGILTPSTSPNGKEARPKAAIIREKGSNSEREMANAMYLAGFDVKDVHMTDLITGRENLEDIQFIGAVGGFSNSDVLGSAKGWAGAFLYNEKAKTALQNFFKRDDTLSVGICNGCQLFMELELVNPEHEVHGKMLHNDSHKHESIFTSVKVQENNSVMLSSLAGTTLGVWVSHGEGKFKLPYEESNYNIVAKYSYDSYPANPNGSDYNTAMLCDATGRHLVMMPHIERSTFPWNWAYYPSDKKDEVSPWIEAFVNARLWVEKQ